MRSAATSIRCVFVALISLALVACSNGTPAASDVGITKDAILIGGTDPLSGPAAAYGTIAKAALTRR